MLKLFMDFKKNIKKEGEITWTCVKFESFFSINNNNKINGDTLVSLTSESNFKSIEKQKQKISIQFYAKQASLT